MHESVNRPLHMQSGLFEGEVHRRAEVLVALVTCFTNVCGQENLQISDARTPSALRSNIRKHARARPRLRW